MNPLAALFIFGEFPQRAAPVIERSVKSFLPDTPKNLLLRGDINKIPIIIGVNKDETSYFYPLIVRSYIPGDSSYHERTLVPKFLEATTPYTGAVKDRIMSPIMH
ncbi:esterase-like protein, partial [Leptotrombidium deliense]